jgi:hypothetical protein
MVGAFRGFPLDVTTDPVGGGQLDRRSGLLSRDKQPSEGIAGLPGVHETFADPVADSSLEQV